MRGRRGVGGSILGISNRRAGTRRSMQGALAFNVVLIISDALHGDEEANKHMTDS